MTDPHADRRNPKQVVDAMWTGAMVGYKAYVDASFEERADRSNWCIIAAFPPTDVRCGEYSRPNLGIRAE